MTSHDAIWAYSYQRKGWQAVCRTCKWTGDVYAESDGARQQMIDHKAGDVTGCICGGDIKRFVLGDTEGWMHTATQDDRCYPDGSLEEQEAKATPYDARG